MSGSDRSLALIVAGVVVLVVAALAAVRLRPEPAYRDADTPEGVTHDYLLAMERQEWSRAYGYLSPGLPCYPESAEVFVDDVTEQGFVRDFENVELRVEGASVEGDVALVTVQETRYWTGGLFDSGQSTSDFEVKLQREADGWKIVRADRYWWWTWHEPGDAPCRTGRTVRPVTVP